MDKLEPIRRVFRSAGLYHHASDDLLCGELASAVQPAAYHWDGVNPPVPIAPQPQAAIAWQEGYRAGVNDERISDANIGIAGFDAKVEPNRSNPYADPQPQAEPVALIQWAEKSEPENHPWAAGYEAAREYVRMQLRAAPQPQAAEGLTVKEAWWAGARAALGLPGETPREQVASAFVIAGILAKRDEQAPQPSPQASAEDVALVDKWVNLAHTREIEAWDRIRASLGVGK